MVYAPDPSGDAVGRLFAQICAANSSADRKDDGLARVRRLGATPGWVRVHRNRLVDPGLARARVLASESARRIVLTRRFPKTSRRKAFRESPVLRPWPPTDSETWAQPSDPGFPGQRALCTRRQQPLSTASVSPLRDHFGFVCVQKAVTSAELCSGQ
jgi:hypothetical protein